MMDPLRGFLDRFRTVLAPPGPATGRVMPPADVATRLQAELAPVLAIIDDVEHEAATMVEAAEERARIIAAAAQREASAAMAEAQATVPETRAGAVRSRTDEIDREIEGIRDAARQEAARIGSGQSAVADRLVSRVLNCVATYAGDAR
jgi:vacuolar-type H+-ATPase subunit H